ncbi:MAG: DUF4037 domain-containing protein [Planctomycetales bacterium]|nr:DUF4037 domain-containing protein [Planctomycetales bacterium]
MTTGLAISQEFVSGTLMPLLQQELADDFDRLAIAIVGTGSDVLGLDDEISRDHHWGPRANVMYLRADAPRVADQVRAVLSKVPPKFGQYDVQIDIGNLTGVCCCQIEDFFGRFLGTEQLPASDLDWVRLCEVDLFHVTAGTIVYDGPGELTRRCDYLAYYPDAVWRKRLADWCMYVTGREAPYNLHRVAKRNDDLTCTIYFGLCIKRLMELCFTLNRRYAPYTKWLNRLFRNLPNYADQLAPMIDAAVAEPAWNKKVQLLIDANYVIADALADLQLCPALPRRKFDDSLTDLSLYDAAAHIYSQLPEELFSPSFNQVELWEKMAREVLFDSNDYIKNGHHRKA